jgi:hypothetical protein
MSWPLFLYRLRLCQYGISAAELFPYLGEVYLDKMCVDRGVCPRCGQPLKVERDPRQAGDKPYSGEWWCYRCPCGYGVDRVEPAPKIAVGTA